MSTLAKYSAIFVEGATTSVKAGSKLCYYSLGFTLLSAIGMFISQLIENNFNTCSFEELRTYVPTCLTSFLKSEGDWAGFRIFLRLFDAMASLLLVAVGNCLENVFRGSVMARVLSGTLRLSALMVVFEICFASGLDLQERDFYKKWAYKDYMAQMVATYFMIDHSSDMIWTLDNVLYTYFLLILGFLSSDHEKFSNGYTTTCYVGFVGGMLFFLNQLLNYNRNAFFGFIAMIGTLVLQICQLVIVGWTGKALGAMESDLVGKRGKKGKKHRKGKKSNKV